MRRLLVVLGVSVTAAAITRAGYRLGRRRCLDPFGCASSAPSWRCGR